MKTKLNTKTMNHSTLPAPSTASVAELLVDYMEEEGLEILDLACDSGLTLKETQKLLDGGYLSQERAQKLAFGTRRSATWWMEAQSRHSKNTTSEQKTP